MSKCDEIFEKCSVFLDNELNDEEKKDFLDHIATCEQCSSELTDLELLLDNIKDIEQVELPDGFHETFMKKLTNEKGTIEDDDIDLNYLNIKMPKKIKTKKHKYMNYNKYLYAAASFVLFSFFIGTSLQFIGIDFKNTQLEKTVTNITATEGGFGRATFSGDLQDDSMLKSKEHDVIYYNIALEVDDISESLKRINELSGYNTLSNFSRNSDSENAHVTRQINISEYKNTITSLKNMGKVLNSSERIEKISYNLKDLNAQLLGKQSEKTRLFALVKNSQSVDVMFNIDNRINTIDQEINNIKTAIYNYENLSKTPNITITLIEKGLRVENETLKERTRNSFVSSLNITSETLQNILIFSAQSFIPIIISISFCYFIFTIIVKWRGRNEKNKI